MDNRDASNPNRTDGTFTDANWNSMGTYPAMGQSVNCIVVDKKRGLVYAGGSFTWRGTLLANYVAVWDGTTWKSLGSGLNNTVNALVLDKSGNLYAGGMFTTAGSIIVNHVAEWNGTNWQCLGTGVFGNVRALAMDTQGNLYAGGTFILAGGITARGVAAWNGSTWSALDSGVTPSALYRKVNTLVFDKEGNLYAGGAFTNAGFVAANYVAKWNGSTWSSLGSGMNGPVFALATDASDNIYAGGTFTNGTGVETNFVAKWDGSTWSALSTGVNGNINALAVDGSGRIYAGGLFSLGGNTTQTNIATWNETHWEAKPVAVNGPVLALALDASGALYAGGTFTQAGNVNAYDIARWSEHLWQPMQPITPALLGLNASVDALALDQAGNLFVGGDFMFAGGLTASHVAKWNGKNWATLGTGLDGPVYAMAFDHSNNLYVAGSFAHAGGISANNVAKWNGRNWMALDTGVNDVVSALVVDPFNHVYAGGYFTLAGGQSANFVAMWDGTTWSQVGGGLDNGVSALALDSNGTLYAGGFLPMLSYFFGAPFGDTHVAACNGSWWYTLPDTGHVSALAVDRTGTLYAGGNMFIAEMTSGGWVNLGSGLTGALGPFSPPYVNALVFDGAGNLYAGGSFNTSGQLPASCVATWNGASWSALGSGVNNWVNALALDMAGHLYVGGGFTTAGTNASPNLALAEVAPGMGVLSPTGTFFANGQNTLDFGTVRSGDPATRFLVITNIFADDLAVSGLSIVGTNAEEFSVNGFQKPFALHKGSAINLSFKFAPKAPGPRSGTLQIRNNAAFNNPFLVDLTAYGQLSTRMVLSDSTNLLTYGEPISFTATIMPVPDGGAVQFYDNDSLLSNPRAVYNGVASSPPVILSAGRHLLTASYSGTSYYGSCSTTHRMIRIIRQLPVILTGQRKYDGTALASTAILSITNLIGNDQILIKSGTAVLAAAAVGSQPIISFRGLALTGEDSLNYTLEKAKGATLIVAEPPLLSGIVDRRDGSIIIHFSGSPSGTYVVQASTNLNDWYNFSTNICEASGTWTVTNTATGLRCFFRASLLQQ